MKDMKIEDIIYQTTRGILNIEDKLRIATVFLFCEKVGVKKLSELLYAKNHNSYIDALNKEYENYGVDFTINFSNQNVRSAFYNTLEKVKKEWDSDGFLKAVSENDPYALAICEIINYDFDKVKIKKLTKEIANQLSIW